jgi:hypothetical protein
VCPAAIPIVLSFLDDNRAARRSLASEQPIAISKPAAVLGLRTTVFWRRTGKAEDAKKLPAQELACINNQEDERQKK